jgi:hypothetical protein
MKNIFLFVCVCFFFFPTNVNAHIGGGPPILKINDKYAQTNPYFQQEVIAMNVSQDVAPETYLVGKQIKLAIDVPQLLKQTTFPSDVKNTISFRWSVFQGTNFDNVEKTYEYGDQVSYTFQKAKSYLVLIEAKNTDDEFIVIDTVQLNVVPSLAYRLPTVSLFVGQDKNPEKPMFFVSQANVDSSSKIAKSLWDFGENKLLEGSSIERTFDPMTPYNTRMVFHRIVDSQGLSTDVGFAAENFQGAIRFVSFTPTKKPPVSVGSYDQAKQRAGHNSLTKNLLFVIVGVVVLLGVIKLFYEIVKRGKLRLKPKP